MSFRENLQTSNETFLPTNPFRQLVQKTKTKHQCPKCGTELTNEDSLSVAEFLQILAIISVGICLSSIVIYCSIQYVDGEKASYDPAKELNSELKMLISLSKDL